MFSRSVNETSSVIRMTIIGDAIFWSVAYGWGGLLAHALMAHALMAHALMAHAVMGHALMAHLVPMSHCYKYGHNVAFITFVACHNVALYTVLMSHTVLMSQCYDLVTMSHCSVLKEPPLVSL
jgi:hypothetical protein